MSYALVEDIPASWERHAVIARCLEPMPRGLLLHLAGPTDEGFRIIKVWETEGDWQRFAPDFQDAVRSIDPVVGPRTISRDLRSAVLVVGEAWRGVPVAIHGEERRFTP